MVKHGSEMRLFRTLVYLLLSPFSEQNTLECQIMKGFTQNPHLQLRALEYICYF